MTAENTYCGFGNVIKCIYYIYLLQKDMDVNSRDPLQNIIPFRIKGVEISRFDSSGNLKIGTTTTTAPTVRLDISGGSARVNSGSATSTALTTTGRIGVNTASPGADLDVSGVARMAALSATSTALTTTGRIGVNTASPGADLDVSGVARVTASTATATALTTTGRIGVNTAAPTVDLDVTGVSRLSASSATATALTTTGRIGVNMAAPTVDLDVSGVARVTASTAASTALTTTGRIGVNTTTPGADFEVNGLAKLGNVNIVPLYVFTTHTFTNAGATGRTGPTLSAIRSVYSGVSWAQNNSYLSMTGDNGIQLWTVPVTGIYTIRAKGAAGFIGPGLSNARGIDIQTTTTLIKGEVIKILVGQRGSWHGGWTYLGGGGGGSFVVRENSTPIIIAGGGGGTGGRTNLITGYANSDATRETYGMDGAENPSSGGTNGGGGKGGQGSGGGGFLQDGFAGINNNILPSSFLTGGGGGGGAGAGGFGGGGYAQDITGSEAGGGGGGGYSGGGGGNDYNPGGGGGSYAISTMTVNGYNTDHGSVTITLTTPSVALDVNGVAVVNGSSATAPALTTVGRIGVNTAAPTVDLEVAGAARLTASSATATALTTVGRIGVNIPDPMADLDVSGVARVSASSATSTALTTTGRIGVNMATPTADLDVSGVARVSASSATSTALTTVGRIGVNMATPTADLDVSGVSRLSASSATSTALTTVGRIGVNTAAPTVALDVNGIMRSNTGLKLGNAATTAMTGSSILDVENTGTARARFTSGTNIFTIGVHSNTTNPSESFIYNETSTPMTFGTSGNERMKITADGKVGIGTNSPEASLHVGTSVSISFNGSTRYGYFRNDGGSGTWFINEALNISFIAENDILIKGNHILVSSDKRIKKNIRDIQGATALSQIRRIQPKVYNKIDDIYHQGDIYGFIAQDVEDVINNTSRINTSIIPNFYCKGEIATIDQTNHIYEISTENEFKFEKILDASGNEITNYKIKLYDEKNNDYICIVIHRIDAKTIRVKCDKEYVYSTIEEYKNTVFIYGQEVHDFYNLDKNSIFTVATAALQEVDRQQQADKARIAELEATVASQQSLINYIL